MDSELDTAPLTFESCHLVLESPIRLQIKLASIRSRSFLEFEEWHFVRCSNSQRGWDFDLRCSVEGWLGWES
jgi:hypothetical protein